MTLLMRSIASRGLLLALALTVAACSDPTAPDGATTSGGLVLLHAVGGAKGVVFVGDTGAGAHRVEFEPEFDGGGMRLEAGTVLTTSSSWGTNKLYITPVGASRTTEVEMPANSNAGGASLGLGFHDASVVVALRATGSLGLVAVSGDSAVVTEMPDVARCPADVVVANGDAWVVDQNAACDGDYSVLGDSRLVRLGAIGDARDTLVLPGVRNATSGVLVGSILYVASQGVATYAPDYSSVTFDSPGAVTAVDVNTGQVVGSATLPAGTNGAVMSFGRDSMLYVTSYLNTNFQTGVFVVDPATASLVSTNPLGLHKSDGSAPQCAVATADHEGLLYCPENQGSLQTTMVYVFDPATGNEVRHFVTGGTGAVDIAVR